MKKSNVQTKCTKAFLSIKQPHFLSLVFSPFWGENFLVGPERKYLGFTIYFCWGTTIWLHATTLKTGPHDVMSNAIKDLNVSFSSQIGFEVEWHSSQFDKWYQSQGHEFESRECHCEGGIVGGTTIWLSTTTLKISPRGVMSNAIKDLSVFLITNWFWDGMTQLMVRQFSFLPTQPNTL